MRSGISPDRFIFMDDKSGQIQLLIESHKVHMRRFGELKERIEELESAFLQHSKRSQNNQSFLMLLFGLFAGIAAIAMFGLSIKGSIGNSKISYSSNSVVQILTGILTVGGGSFAYNRYSSIKSQLTNHKK